MKCRAKGRKLRKVIAHLTGKVLAKTPTASIIDCQGVGYEVHHTPFCAESIAAEQVSLFIHTHVREDALQLFGFADTLERDLFRELLKVSGIGPKMAIGILSGISAADLMKAIQQKDGTRLQKIPGIGKKTADRLSIELADRLKNLSGASAAMNSKGAFDLPKESELESVLLNLGYQRQEVQRAVQQARKNSSEFDQWPLETMVKTALKELMQGKPV